MPKNTLEANPLEQKLKVHAGVVVRVDIMFPPGPEGLTHVRIYDDGHQLWPFALGESYASDNETISFPEFIEIIPGMTELRFVGWNEDDTYDHTVSIRISILPKWVAAPYVIFKGFVDVFKGLTGME